MLYLLGLALAAIQLEQLLPHPHFEVRETGVPLENPNAEIFYKGKLVQCHVPEQASWQLDTAPSEPTAEQIAEAQNLLEQSRACTYWVDSYSYWGYRLCHNDTVKQIHPERDGDKFVFSDRMVGFNMGKRAGSAPPELRDGLWHYKAPYDFGTVCDLTGTERSVDVFYYCDPDTDVEVIKNVRETHICVYEVMVATPHLCGVFDTAVNAVNYIECYNPDFLAEQAEEERLIAEGLEEADGLLDQILEGIHDMFGELPEAADPDVEEKYIEWLERTGKTRDSGAESEASAPETFEPEAPEPEKLDADAPIVPSQEESKEPELAQDTTREPEKAEDPEKLEDVQQIEHSEL